MKALSLWQPWATAIACGSKRIETRSWQTPYRGALLIHAAARCVEMELIGCQCCWNWCGALMPAVGKLMGTSTGLKSVLPFGALLGIAVLTDVRPTDSFTLGEIEEKRVPPGESDIYTWTERQMGNFDLGRYGWVLDCVQAFERPIFYKGARGLFDVPDEVIYGVAVK